MTWKDISLFKFQQIDLINARVDLADIDKLLFSTCVAFGLTEHELDNMDARRALKMTAQLEKVFSTDMTANAHGRIGRYRLYYDVSKMTFGQFIDLSFFLTQKPPIQYAHFALATVAKGWIKKGEHSVKATYFLNQPVGKVVGCIAKLTESFESFRSEYKSLFGVDPEVNGAEASEDKFNKRYGWVYSASQVAEYQRIKLDEAFELPVRQALNALAYLKAKAKYEAEMLKKR